MKKFTNLLPAEAFALRDGVWQPVPASQLVRGDVVRVQSGAGYHCVVAIEFVFLISVSYFFFSLSLSL